MKTSTTRGRSSGWNRVAGPPVLKLLQRRSEVLEELAIDEFELTTGHKDCNQAWDAVDDQARRTLACAQPVSAILLAVTS